MWSGHSIAFKCFGNGGLLLAVLGGGLNVLTPPENEKLYWQILENKGLIISEYEKIFSRLCGVFLREIESCRDYQVWECCGGGGIEIRFFGDSQNCQRTR